MPAKDPDPGYRLPATIDPGSTKCARVYIPNDPLYFAAFWRSYEYLTQWTAWERDAEHHGAAAAAVWRAAFDQARAEWEAGGGCGMTDVRQNPTEPCKLEKSDDGITWEQFADLLLCGSQIASTPWPEGRGTETPAEAASDDMIHYWRGVAVEINDHLALAEDCPDFVYDISNRVYSEIGVWALSHIIQLCADMAAHTEAERNAALNPAIFYEAREAALCSTVIGEQDPVTDNRSFLEVWSDALGQWLEQTSYWLMDSLAGLASALGSQDSQGWSRAAWADAGGGAGFGWGAGECFDWVHEWNGAEIGAGDWVIVKGAFTAEGYEWEHAPGYDVESYIKSTIPATWVKQAQLDVDITDVPTGNWVEIQGMREGGQVFWDKIPVQAGMNTYTFAWYSSIMLVDELRLRGAVFPEVTSVTTLRVRFAGMGTDPWL